MLFILYNIEVDYEKFKKRRKKKKKSVLVDGELRLLKFFKGLGFKFLVLFSESGFYRWERGDN